MLDCDWSSDVCSSDLEAEAAGTAVRIEAEAERTAAQLRGQGVALFRAEVARGLAQAAREMESNSVDQSLILFSMWTESLRHVAENGKGNVLFLDGSPEGMQKQMLDLMAMQQLHVVQPPPK
jgi:prepilin-type processing-associated H-X9-DG protein